MVLGRVGPGARAVRAFASEHANSRASASSRATIREHRREQALTPGRPPTPYAQPSTSPPLPRCPRARGRAEQRWMHVLHGLLAAARDHPRRHGGHGGHDQHRQLLRLRDPGRHHAGVRAARQRAYRPRDLRGPAPRARAVRPRLRAADRVVPGHHLGQPQLLQRRGQPGLLQHRARRLGLLLDPAGAAGLRVERPLPDAVVRVGRGLLRGELVLGRRARRRLPPPGDGRLLPAVPVAASGPGGPPWWWSSGPWRTWWWLDDTGPSRGSARSPGSSGSPRRSARSPRSSGPARRSRPSRASGSP